MVASQKLTGGDSAIVVMCWWQCSKVKICKGIKPSSLKGFEPAPFTLEALAAQYLHGSLSILIN
jgi:hypothetical protein